jgi:RNA polymerase sigma factor (sigma-70 family)
VDESRRARLLEANVALVVEVARQLRGRGVLLSDLIQEGLLALWSAIEELERADLIEFAKQARFVIWNRLRDVVEKDDDLHATARGLLVDQPGPDAGLEGLRAEKIEKANALLALLSEDQASVLRLRFGIDSSGPLTVEAVARSLGMSRHKVGALESRAMSALRRAVHRLRWSFPRLERR